MSRDHVHSRRWLILGVLILALFGVTLDNTILNIALPTLATELRASAGQLQWMVDAYVLVFAGLLLVAGSLSDRYGRRLMLVAGLALFGVGSALAPFVGSAEQLILLRAFMGLGAALTMPATLSIIVDVFDAGERPKAIAVWSAVSGLGIIAGPLLGGWLLEHFAWSSVFVVNVPFVALGIAATLAVVPESKAGVRTPLDPIGAALSVVALASLVYGIIEIPTKGAGDLAVAGSLGVAAAFLFAFFAWERQVDHPMLDVRLFANPRFSAASLSIALVFFSLMGAMFFLTQYLQGVQGLSAFETGLRFIPIAVGVIIVAPLSAKLTSSLGARMVTAAGLFVVAAGLGLLATVGLDSSDLHVAAVLFVIAAGIGLAGTPATDAIIGALPKDQFGVGSAVNDTTRELGGALGVAILGSLFAASYSAAMAGASAGLPMELAAAGPGFAGRRRWRCWRGWRINWSDPVRCRSNGIRRPDVADFTGGRRGGCRRGGCCAGLPPLPSGGPVGRGRRRRARTSARTSARARRCVADGTNHQRLISTGRVHRVRTDISAARIPGGRNGWGSAGAMALPRRHIDEEERQRTGDERRANIGQDTAIGGRAEGGRDHSHDDAGDDQGGEDDRGPEGE